MQQSDCILHMKFFNLSQILLAEDAGATAVLVFGLPGSHMNRLKPSLGEKEPDIPAIFVDYEAGMACYRAIRRGIGCSARIYPVCALKPTF
jgi:hypothetical protein